MLMSNEVLFGKRVILFLSNTIVINPRSKANMHFHETITQESPFDLTEDNTILEKLATSKPAMNKIPLAFCRKLLSNKLQTMKTSDWF